MTSPSSGSSTTLRSSARPRTRRGFVCCPSGELVSWPRCRLLPRVACGDSADRLPVLPCFAGDAAGRAPDVSVLRRLVDVGASGWVLRPRLAPRVAGECVPLLLAFPLRVWGAEEAEEEEEAEAVALVETEAAAASNEVKAEAGPPFRVARGARTFRACASSSSGVGVSVAGAVSRFFMPASFNKGVVLDEAAEEETPEAEEGVAADNCGLADAERRDMRRAVSTGVDGALNCDNHSEMREKCTRKEII